MAQAAAFQVPTGRHIALMAAKPQHLTALRASVGSDASPKTEVKARQRDMENNSVLPLLLRKSQMLTGDFSESLRWSANLTAYL